MDLVPSLQQYQKVVASKSSQRVAYITFAGFWEDQPTVSEEFFEHPGCSAQNCRGCHISRSSEGEYKCLEPQFCHLSSALLSLARLLIFCLGSNPDFWSASPDQANLKSDTQTHFSKGTDVISAHSVMTGSLSHYYLNL